MRLDDSPSIDPRECTSPFPPCLSSHILTLFSYSERASQSCLIIDRLSTTSRRKYRLRLDPNSPSLPGTHRRRNTSRSQYDSNDRFPSDEHRRSTIRRPHDHIKASSNEGRRVGSSTGPRDPSRDALRRALPRRSHEADRLG